MSDTRNSAQRKALWALGAVNASDAAAWATVEPATLAQLIRAVSLASRKYTRADDVDALASVTVARLYEGDVQAAANAACFMADKTVRAAHSGVDSLDRFAGDSAGMVDVIEHAGIDRASMPALWCPRPEALYETTDSDVWRMTLATVRAVDVDAWRILRDAGKAYRAHGDRQCDVCQGAQDEAADDVARTGRRVTLAGILAHTRGLTNDDSQFHALRRLTLAAVARVDRRRVLAVAYGVRGDAHRGDWTGAAVTRTGSELLPVQAPTADALASLAGQAHSAAQRRDVARVQVWLAYADAVDVRDALALHADAAREAARAASALARAQRAAQRAATRTDVAARGVAVDVVALAQDLAPLGDAWRARMAGEPLPARPSAREADKAPGKRERAARGLPDSDAVRVTCTVDDLGYPAALGYGTGRKRVTRVRSEQDYADKREPLPYADRMAERIAGQASRAVKRQERSRGNGGTGQYGAQTSARPSYSAPWRP